MFKRYEVTLSAVYRAGTRDGIIVPIKIPSEDNFSDSLTKSSLNQDVLQETQTETASLGFAGQSASGVAF